MKHLPFRDRAFDLVYSVRAFKYSSDPYRVLEETYRISRNDGLVSIYEGNKRTSLSYLIYLLRYPLSKRRHFWSAGVSPFLMKKYCATAGFGKISYDGVLFLPERFYGIGKTRKSVGTICSYGKSRIQDTLFCHLRSWDYLYRNQEASS